MELKVSIAQMGPYCGDFGSNLAKAVEMFERAVKEGAPDIVLFTEMMTVPYFGAVKDDRYFAMAEPRDGRTVTTFVRKAEELGTSVIPTFFDKEVDGKTGRTRYFNSAAVITPDKGLVGVYRKVHLPKVSSETLTTDEKYYFEQGDDLPVFDVKGVRIGILICYDRSFPESWRTLWLKGAQVVFLSVATFGFRRAIFTKELEVRAAENHIFVVAANKAGNEAVEGERHVRDHFGHSCVIDPYGKVLSQLGDEPFTILHQAIDLNRIVEADTLLDWRRDRSPRLYAKIAEQQEPAGAK